MNLIFKTIIFVADVLNAIKTFLFVLSFIGVFIYGYGVAHSEVATECHKLNRFYVGDNVYDCKLRVNKEPQNE